MENQQPDNNQLLISLGTTATIYVPKVAGKVMFRFDNDEPTDSDFEVREGETFNLTLGNGVNNIAFRSPDGKTFTIYIEPVQSPE